MKNIVERTIIKIGGNTTKSLIYNVMDPAGSFINISQNRILRSLGIILIR